MNPRLVDGNNETIHEFPEGFDVASLISGLLTRAKFTEGFDPFIVNNPWVMALHVSAHERSILKDAKPSLDDTHLLAKFSAYLLQNMPNEWNQMSSGNKAQYIRDGLYPHSISDQRAFDMIEDIEQQCRKYANHLGKET